MKKPVSITPFEGISFLKVVHSFFLRDEKLTPVEENVLSMLVAAFQIKAPHQKEFQVMFFTNVDSMAEEIHKITDRKVRLYLLAIIQELYRIEKKTSRRFSKDERETFESTYNSLLRKVKIDQEEVEKLISIDDPDRRLPADKGGVITEFSSGIDSLKAFLGLGTKT
jgi:hypothetical protein